MIDPIDVARRLFSHRAFKNSTIYNFDHPSNGWVREHWTKAVVQAIGATGLPPDPERFAQALYEYSEWGYKQPWGANSRVCKPWRQASLDVLEEIAP